MDCLNSTFRMTVSTISVVALTIVGHPSSFARTCEDVFDNRRDSAPLAWDKSFFSDPNSHKASDFKYIVHRVLGTHPNRVLEIKRFIESAVASDYLLSASIVSDHFGTMAGNFGFILKVPSQLIVTAKSHDLGIRNNWSSSSINKVRLDPFSNAISELNFDEYKSRLRHFGLDGPGRVLKKTERWLEGTQIYSRTNEIVIDKSLVSDNLRIEVIGIIIRKPQPPVRTQNGGLISSSIDADLDLARDLGLPPVVIDLPEFARPAWLN